MSTGWGNEPVLCVAEDRRAHEPALQVLVASIAQTNPGLRVALFCPDPTDAFADWLRDYPAVTLRREGFGALGGWNVKPAALSRLLDEGAARPVWFDADMIAAGPLGGLLDNPGDTLLVAEEALWGGEREDRDAMRARAWGLPVGRTLPHALNSCIVGVTAAHRPLLEAWAKLLGSETYQSAQKVRFVDRPIHLGSDQDVLTALLCSEPFATVPLRILRRGVDIVQYFGPLGFTVPERLRAMVRGLPPILHSQGAKPWLGERRSMVDRPGVAPVLRAYADVSPYVLHARRLKVRSLSGEDWTRSLSRGGAALRAVSPGSVALAGLPVAAAMDLARFGRWIVGQIRRR
jgi:hypothetical protein